MLLSCCVFYVFVGNYVVDTFVKCGEIEYTRKIFDGMLEKKVTARGARGPEGPWLLQASPPK